MGGCFGKLKTSSEAAPAPAPARASVKPSAETRRKLLQEAAEKRRIEAEYRGIKDPQKFKTHEGRLKELERRARKSALQGTPVLKWTRD